MAKVVRREIITLTCEFCNGIFTYFNNVARRPNLIEIVETWLHQILYICELYPKAIFKQQKKFQVPVYIALHPEVHEYIANFVQSCYPLLEKGDVKFISLTVLDDDIPIEKFVLEIRSLLHSIDIPSDVILESESIFSLADLEQYWRACLMKLISYQTNTLSNNNKTFSLSIETTDGGLPQQPKENDDCVDWIPADQYHSWKTIKPLKSVELDLLFFNTFVMEASRKGKERCP